MSTAAQAATLLVLARSLGPIDFGQFAAVLGGLTALGFFADGGATAAVGRHHPQPATIVQILRAGRLLSIATLLVSVPVLGAVAHASGSAVVSACLLLCAWVPLERQAEIAGAYLLARGHEGLVGMAYLLRRVPALGAVLLVPVAPLPVFSVAMVTTAGLAVAVLGNQVAAATGQMSKRVRPGERWLDVLIPPRELWRLLRPFWMVVAGLGVRQVDVAVLGVTGGATAAGVFAPASRLAPALLLVPGTYTQLLLGRLSAGGQQLTASPVIGVAAVSTAAFVPLALLADLWVPLLLGAAYAGSIDVIRVVVLSLVLAAVSSVFASALHAADRSARVAVAVWTGATTTVLAIAVLGAAYGAVGAAVGVAVGYVVQLGLMAMFHRSRSQPRLRSALC